MNLNRILGATIVTMFLASLGGSVRGDEKEAKAVLDKAIKAIGGEEKLGKLGVLTWKTKGKITLGESENEFKGQTTIEGLEHYRSEFEGEFNGTEIKGVTVLNGKKGWRKFGDNVNEFDEDALALEKRNVYLQVIPVTLVPLNGKGFKLESAAEEKVGDKPASVIKATGPEGKSFRLYFDKESSLLVKQVATVTGFNGDEFEQETRFTDYKDFGGIKKATKVESKRDGNPFVNQTVTDFKSVDKADPEAFTEPK